MFNFIGPDRYAEGMAIGFGCGVVVVVVVVVVCLSKFFWNFFLGPDRYAEGMAIGFLDGKCKMQIQMKFFHPNLKFSPEPKIPNFSPKQNFFTRTQNFRPNPKFFAQT